MKKFYLLCMLSFLIVGFNGCANNSYKTTQDTLPVYKKQEQEKIKQSNGKKIKTKYKFSVNAPKGAIIKIMNIRPKYHDNIELKPGKYHIVVTKPGYKKHDSWITLNNDMTYNATLKKITPPKIKNNYFKHVSSIDWSNNNERFSLVYDSKNDLIWAFQNAYVDYVKKNHPSKAITVLDAYRIGNKYYRELYFKFDTIVYEGYFRTDKSKYYRFRDNNKLAIYYKAKYGKPSIKKAFGTLSQLKINGIKSAWRIPTYKEVKRNNPFKKYQKYFAMHFDSEFYSPKYRELGQSTFNLPILMTGYYGDVRNGYVWPYKKNSSGFYVISYNSMIKSMGIYQLSLKNNVAFILPVRKISSEYDKIIFNKNYTPEQKLAYLTSKLTERALQVSKKKIKKPKKIPHIKPKKLARGEFEKSSNFNKRLAAYKQEIMQKNSDIDKKNAQMMQEYLIALEAEDIRYKRLKKHNSDKNFIEETANAMAQKAMRMIFGDPKFTDISYNADKELFSVTLYSSSNHLQMPVKIPVPIKKAKKFKADLLNDKLVPVVSFFVKNNKLHFKELKIISNEAKIEKDLTLVKELGTPQAYKDFLEEYPDYKRKSQVEKMLQNSIEKQAYRRASSLEELEAFVKKYPHSKYTKKAKKDIEEIKAQQTRKAEAYAKKRATYNAVKKVGDKVCKDGTTALVLSITMKAFVERVNGDNIQLRISDTEGTSPYYNGVRLYKNTLIWDRYNNWYKCR